MDEVTQLKLKNAELQARLAAAERELHQAQTLLHQQDQEMESLRQFDLEMTRTEDLDFVLNLVLIWARERAQADYGVIASWDETRKDFEVLRAGGIPLEIDFQPGDQLYLPPELCPPEFSNGDSAHILMDKSETRLVSELRHADGNLIGVLVLQRHNNFGFADMEKKFVRGISDRLAISLHTTNLITRVQALSLHRKQLFRMLSHDLRQPLTVLMGYIQLVEHALQKGTLEVIPSYMKHVATGAKDLSNLLEEVLMMEQVADASRGGWKKISLKKVCEQAIEKHGPEAALKALKLVLNLTEDEAMCHGSYIELKEAMSNILNNAIKYTPENGEVTITLAQEGSHWVYTVKDTGYGIDEARQARLFESFYRAQQPGTEHIKGTGLGLSLVKTIIEKHGGEVFFSSKTGAGSTFGFWLPVPTDE